MSVKVKVYSDFVCPFCFVGKGPLDEVMKEKDIEVEWMPFELRPSPTPKIDPWNEPDKVNAWNAFIAPTAKKFGVDMVLPRMSPHPYTHLAFEGCHFAKEHGKGNAFYERVFTAFFQEEQNIEEIDVLTKLAEEVGLQAEAFKEALVTRKYKDVQAAALKHAYEEARITAVPTFVIGDQVIQGLASKERLAEAIDKATEKGSTTGMQCDIDGNC
ncbi:DsbA family oxidoreductase [Priestia taiwanensis]|uniref:2-hydroxychromene-2-carboxylate isomerase n=1 Tax=Priestia taiwanensis TaxID=1347902 RepID=A0A917AJ38_9BACI|nr:DsbA family oxidoreductase [Priestia taiwanensis]MBM7361544.1 putative DsbA family dithiol-disulfide isomerase [Priestia taiwanensis]GGE55033.1 2-hydroxychromene-2-carboxylate isomerase [Priestia taiwanensis]